MKTAPESKKHRLAGLGFDSQFHCGGRACSRLLLPESLAEVLVLGRLADESPLESQATVATIGSNCPGQPR
eukprot:861540-Amphidinium_carterae.1